MADPATFDLDTYAAEYSGRTAIQRLLQVAKLAPARRTKQAALTRALEIIKRDTVDTELYRVARAQLEDVSSRMTNRDGEAPTGMVSNKNDDDDDDDDDDDEAWLARTADAAQRTTEKLEAELRNYSLNMIKESTRQTLLAMARHERARGDLAAAGRTLAKVRDYQSGAEHEVETYLSVIEVALTEGSYGVVLPTVIKAQHAIARLASSAVSSTTMSGVGAGVLTGEQIRERERRQRAVQGVTAETGAKLAFAKGCALVATGQWDAGVRELAGVRGRLGEWEGSIFSLSDIAMYIALAALATLDRAQLKSLVLENTHVRYVMDHGGAPWTRQVVEAFVGARYATVLQLLEAYRWRPTYDLHIHAQVPALLETIRHRAYVQYFEPFQNVQLARMAATFGVPTQGAEAEAEAFERDVVGLVQAGKLGARVDDIKKVLYARNPDKRRALYRDTLQTGQIVQESTRQAFLRMQLHQAGILIETPQDRKKRVAKVAGLGREGQGDLTYLEGSDEEMLQTA
ncbi:hypothetical protein NliqN6_3235 [Naganishia liquefaciens]|uniref:PCI domain-containing protein n=1 Tax=Naganishia liquefaciens TaxID=104408 RepID=A0A8H3TTI5_9TREE|nr:hypothetical protein NliqN6_3235 [Naganishia liquefaciens]